jgi:hypothetical protein
MRVCGGWGDTTCRLFGRGHAQACGGAPRRRAAKRRRSPASWLKPTYSSCMAWTWRGRSEHKTRVSESTLPSATSSWLSSCQLTSLVCVRCRLSDILEAGPPSRHNTRRPHQGSGKVRARLRARRVEGARAEEKWGPEGPEEEGGRKKGRSRGGQNLCKCPFLCLETSSWTRATHAARLTSCLRI